MKQNPLAFQTLDSYIAAKELARRVHLAKISDAELRDQATRAAKSTFLCLCEGLPNTSVAARNKYFQESLNSLYETLGAMDLAGTIGAAQPEDAAAVQELGVRLVQMMRGLLTLKISTPQPWSTPRLRNRGWLTPMPRPPPPAPRAFGARSTCVNE